MSYDKKLCEECEACCGEGCSYVSEDDLPKLMGIVDGNRVLLVCGNDVKIEHDMDFVEGGNDLEDDWIRQHFGDKVVIIDYAIRECERPFICYHECCERRIIAKISNLPTEHHGGEEYDKAHIQANKEERDYRIAKCEEDDDNHDAPSFYNRPHDPGEGISEDARKRIAGIPMKSGKKGSIKGSY